MVGRGLVWLRSFFIRPFPRRSGPRRSRGWDGHELGEGEIALAPAKVERAVQAPLDGDLASDHRVVGLGSLDLKAAELVTDREVRGDQALLGVSEEALQVELWRKRAMGIDIACRGHGEARLPPRDEDFFEEAVGVGHRADAGEAQLLDEPVLERLEEPLDPALGLWRECQDQLDAERGECTPDD